jgi:2-polyprenyl-3-methyl-5-hydroxy-6-metoxy-1,4-benzoquinol methylase
VSLDRYDAKLWRATYQSIADWDGMFADGRWAYLDSLVEAPRYALIAGFVHRLFPRADILDGGCGEGHLFGYLDPARAHYRGFDLSPTAIAQARSRYPAGEFSVSSLDAYRPVPDEHYDAIVFNEVLPHIPDPLETLDRFRALLRPGGAVLISHFQSSNEGANARRLTRLLDTEITAGRYEAVAETEVASCASELRWRVTVLR